MLAGEHGALAGVPLLFERHAHVHVSIPASVRDRQTTRVHRPRRVARPTRRRPGHRHRRERHLALSVDRRTVVLLQSRIPARDSSRQRRPIRKVGLAPRKYATTRERCTAVKQYATPPSRDHRERSSGAFSPRGDSGIRTDTTKTPRPNAPPHSTHNTGRESAAPAQSNSRPHVLSDYQDNTRPESPRHVSR